MIVSRGSDGKIYPLLECPDSTGKRFIDFLSEQSAESKRQCRVALRESYGLPTDPLDADPIN